MRHNLTSFIEVSPPFQGTHLRYASLSARPFRRVIVHPRRRRGLSLALGVFFLGIPNGTLKALNLKVRRTCSGLLPIHILHSRRWRRTLFKRVLCVQKPPRISVFSAPLRGVDSPRHLNFVMLEQASSLNLVLCGVGAALLAGVLLRRRHSLPRPPGPPSLPIIGGLLSMPSEKEWLTFAEWGRKYSTSTVSFSYRVLTSVQATFARSPSSVRP